MAKPRALVLTGYGINCDWETAFAFEKAGAEARRVHVNDLIDGHDSLDRYQILSFPGGFSYGDDISSGKVLANRVKTHLAEGIRRFIEKGGLVIGICNGFQVVVKYGLLGSPEGPIEEQKSTLDQQRLEPLRRPMGPPSPRRRALRVHPRDRQTLPPRCPRRGEILHRPANAGRPRGSRLCGAALRRRGRPSRRGTIPVESERLVERHRRHLRPVGARLRTHAPPGATSALHTTPSVDPDRRGIPEGREAPARGRRRHGPLPQRGHVFHGVGVPLQKGKGQRKKGERGQGSGIGDQAQPHATGKERVEERHLPSSLRTRGIPKRARSNGSSRSLPRRQEAGAGTTA